MAAQIGGMYGLYDDPGLPLELSLQTFPNLIFGTFPNLWAEMARNTCRPLRLP